MPIIDPQPDQQVYEQARQARDARFDGRFFVGVKTTRIYCRPTCPVKLPLARNVLFFPTAAAASESGFRPCLRCRPESSPGTPAWSGTSATVSRGLRLINEGALDRGSVEHLSDRLGVTTRHLSRLFKRHLGASPKAFAQTRRLQAAKKLLNETSLPMTEIALAAGYGSLRRFNDHVLKVYGRSPTELRGQAPTRLDDAFRLELRYRPPYDFDALLQFLSMRAIPGVETVTEDRYQRNIMIAGHSGRISVWHQPLENTLVCELQLNSPKFIIPAVVRIRRLFDLDANPMEIHACLSQDEVLKTCIDGNPGLRVPGCWDPYELLVRAIVGQQVSVKAASGVMGKIARTAGVIADGQLHFPDPESMMKLAPEDLPMPGSRARCVIEVSRAVADGKLELGEQDPVLFRKSLMEFRGIGPWTAEYVAMRVLNDPNAFLSGDLVLERAARQLLGVRTSEELLERARNWQPWRAYAAMYLWSSGTS